jgi:hypothetical protein
LPPAAAPPLAAPPTPPVTGGEPPAALPPVPAPPVPGSGAPPPLDGPIPPEATFPPLGDVLPPLPAVAPPLGGRTLPPSPSRPPEDPPLLPPIPGLRPPLAVEPPGLAIEPPRESLPPEPAPELLSFAAQRRKRRPLRTQVSCEIERTSYPLAESGMPPVKGRNTTTFTVVARAPFQARNRATRTKAEPSREPGFRRAEKFLYGRSWLPKAVGESR